MAAICTFSSCLTRSALNFRVRNCTFFAFKTQTGNAKHCLITTARVTFLQLYDACVMLEQEEEEKKRFRTPHARGCVINSNLKGFRSS